MNIRYVWISIIFSTAMLNSGISKDAPNYPYVQSMDGGVFYARCIPAANTTTSGTTEIYRVREDHDELVDKYDWYSKRGVFLEWSSIAGKVAVLAIQMGTKDTMDDQVELSFYLGGRFLKSWTTNQLIGLGASWGVEVPGGRHAIFRVLGFKQAKEPHEDVFAIQIAKNKKLFFNILTGDLYKKEVLPDYFDLSRMGLEP